MGGRVEVQTGPRNLELALAAHKSLLAEYSLRTRLAEELAAARANDPAVLAELVAKHVQVWNQYKQDQARGLLDRTLATLQIARHSSEDVLREAVNNVCESLSLCVGKREHPETEKSEHT